jgi:VanZ family protein
LPISTPEAAPSWLDTAAHVCEYLLFAWCLVQTGRASTWTTATTLILAFGIPVLWGGALEGVQALLPYRSGSWADALANVIGSLLGAWIGLWFPAPSYSER